MKDLEKRIQERLESWDARDWENVMREWIASGDSSRSMNEFARDVALMNEVYAEEYDQ